MKRSSDIITIYWSPVDVFNNGRASRILFRDPVSISSNLHKGNKHKGEMIACPAVRTLFKNVFSINANVDDEFDIPTDYVKEIAYTPEKLIDLGPESKAGLYKMAKSSLDGYSNLGYNMYWAFFADQPVVARMTAPYYPPVTPTPGAMLSAGEYDIGRWFRFFYLDYHVPLDATRFEVKAGDPLFFLEVFTDKKVVFKRFSMTHQIFELIAEFGANIRRFNKFKTLLDKYRAAENAKIPKMVLAEIKKNVVE